MAIMIRSGRLPSWLKFLTSPLAVPFSDALYVDQPEFIEMAKCIETE